MLKNMTKKKQVLTVDLSMFVIGHMLQTPPLSCERTYNQIEKPGLTYQVDNHHRRTVLLVGLVEPEIRCLLDI